MADILLIHGSCHGAWCWEGVIPHLQVAGHTARAIDLPGHGDTATPVAEVTLDRYARAIADACGKRTVLVGHSMGGYAIAAAGCLVPERIAGLVYLCAYVPREGVSLAQMRMKAPTQPLLPAVRICADGISFTIDPELAPGIFYNDCTEDIATAATARLGVQATAPTDAPFQGTSAQAALPRRYIRCTDDRTIPPAFQMTMTQDWPGHTVEDMACGHSPFLSQPQALAARLARIAESLA